MPSGTVYRPTRVSDFESTKLNFNAQGVSGFCPVGSTNLDLLMADDHLMTGALLVTSGGTLGDYCTFKVIDTNGVLAPPGTVLNQFITTWYLPTQTCIQLDMAYPAKIFAGLSLRLVYVNTALSESSAFIAINYKLHKVLV